MLIYEGIKKDFIEGMELDTVADEIRQTILNKMGRRTADSEYNSWVNSLEYMYKVLNDEDIPRDSGIAIEYNIPQTSKRVDFIISGYDDKNGPEAVIIELKQWNKLVVVDDARALVETYTGGAQRTVVHPSYQAWSYTTLISDYNSAVQDEHISLNPCAYLHNYIRKDNDPIDDKRYEEFTSVSPVFTKGQVSNIREFIKKHIKQGDDKKVLYKIDHGVIRPSKSLQDSISKMIKGNNEFVMIDEQRVAYEQILKLSKKTYNDHKKRTIICKGGPGTGKSVIAIQLLAELTKNGQFVQYVSKNNAPRQVYAEKLRGQEKSVSINNMFKGSGCYTDVGSNMIHTLLVDEAHRLNEKSGIFHNKGENQIKEIIHAAGCSVFFIDECQRVTVNDIGSVEEIKKWAAKENSEVTELELLSQFRCNGSNGYLAFIDDLLEINKTANYNLEGIDYDFKVFDNPNDLRRAIIEKNKLNGKSRLVAGYCWDWNGEKTSDTNYHDIKIDDFEISWNLKNGTIYALETSSINEAGCIHTTQGLEFDYVGVIIGDDIRYEDGKIVTDFFKRASTDQSIKGLKKIYKENPEKALAIADEIIKNTYKVLMTRGMKGCYIYCTNKPLNDYIKHRLSI